jgi:hypothetical protein
VETLRVDASFTLQDLPAMEHYENLKGIHLRCLVEPCVKDVLLMVIERFTHLRRLTLETEKIFFDPPESVTLEEFCDLITEMKQLTLLHIICDNHARYKLIRVRKYVDRKCLHFKYEVDKFKEFVLPRRPNFKFYISCCEMFDKSRVSSCT